MLLVLGLLRVLGMLGVLGVLLLVGVLRMMVRMVVVMGVLAHGAGIGEEVGGGCDARWFKVGGNLSGEGDADWRRAWVRVHTHRRMAG